MCSDDRTRRWGRRPVPASMAGAMAIAILAASAGAGRAAADASASLPQAARIDSLLDQAEAMGVFTGNVAITHEGALVYARSIGLADREARTPNEADTRFALGSITKLYTRILVLQLVSEGRIDPNATVGRYLDGFATAVAEHVTIQELLDHSSGLGQYYDAPGFEPSDVKSATDFLPWIRAEELRFEPGSRSEYSNSGYVVLAAIVEKVEGANYAEVLRRRIVEPLGLRSTDMMFVQGRAPKKAIGYLTSSPGPLEDNLGMHLLGGGDGGIYSTAADLLALDRSLASDTRLLPDSMKLRLINEPLLPKRYASWAEFRASGGWAIAGGAPGVSAVYGTDNAAGRVVVVLANSDEGSAEEVFRRIRAMLRRDAAPPFVLPPARFLYSLLKERGAEYFTANVDRELREHGYDLEDDMVLLAAGQALLKEQAADLAIALYRYYTASFPRIVVAWNDLGDAYLLRGQKDEARKCFTRALELRPANARAKASLEKL